MRKRMTVLGLVLALMVVSAAAAAAGEPKALHKQPMPTPVAEEFAIGDARIRILWKNLGTCDAEVSSRYGRGKEFLPVRPIEKVTITAGEKTSQIIGCSALSADQKCQACIITSEVNPTYITIIIGGRPYPVCVANCP